ncbi:hypothetical protein J27TS8_29980 [Robertmurraya siralis]|uniref:Uncharacterized protein n=1 Tax=Robertmurraya siralis TaxID=77777 RepID=A0A920BU99_9BACI|nr:hypothetical protein [Robertmurraya siralis]PAE19713.1 hypothetical protein CHH80_15175 [Bacillus sp. 7504-2]GIN63005.1 hypothetical protein J27TS8_29980 [Robertmurraya siralis]
MKLKLLAISIIAFGIVSSSTTTFASTDELIYENIKGINGAPVEVEQVSEGIITITNAENPKELLLELDKAEAAKYYDEVESKLKAGAEPTGGAINGNSGGFSPQGASECISKCSKAYRYGTKTSTNGPAEASSTAGGYHWYYGKTHWDGIHGGTMVKWKGSGNAQFIKVDHTISIKGVNMTMSWPPSFSIGKSSATYLGEKKSNSKSHISQFAGGSAVGLNLTTLTHNGTALVRGSDGNDYRPIAAVSIN